MVWCSLLDKEALTFAPMAEIIYIIENVQIKATEQCFPVVLIVHFATVYYNMLVLGLSTMGILSEDSTEVTATIYDNPTIYI